MADVGESAENVYDLAKEKAWGKVADQVSILTAATGRLMMELRPAEANRKGLEDALAALDKAVAAKDRLAAMRQANRATKLAADLSEPFHPQVPAAVARLDYYGRELEIWVVAKDKTKLQLTKDAMFKEWSGLRPAVKSRNEKASERFGALMARLQAAQSREEYGRLATPILDAVDALEGVFKK